MTLSSLLSCHRRVHGPSRQMPSWTTTIPTFRRNDSRSRAAVGRTPSSRSRSAGNSDRGSLLVHKHAHPAKRGQVSVVPAGHREDSFRTLRPVSAAEEFPISSTGSGGCGTRRHANHCSSDMGKTVPIGARTIWCSPNSGSAWSCSFGINGVVRRSTSTLVVSSAPSSFERTNESSAGSIGRDCGGEATRPTATTPASGPLRHRTAMSPTPISAVC